LTQTTQRKIDHIKLAFESVGDAVDSRFYYEPMLQPHPDQNIIPPIKVGNKTQKLPMWVSSMTGGAALAGTINHRLAAACAQHGIGMGLGSCRILLESDTYFADFDLRDTIGADLPFYANLGIAQVEDLLSQNAYATIEHLVVSLRADGLIVHINPLQEWLQPEGDRIKHPPLETLKKLLKFATFPIWVKEVGQGFGPKSLEALLELPISGLEFGAYGGTNFAKLEALRQNNPDAAAFQIARVGHTASEMVEFILQLKNRKPHVFENKLLLVSGGIRSFLDGYYFTQKLEMPALYAQASQFLKYALESTEALSRFIESEKSGLMAAHAYLSLKP
jgi:isopentenyl-diphosphate delta-isomerase